MADLLAQFAQLVAQIIAAPEQPLPHYSLVTPAARAVLPDPSQVLAAPPYEAVPTTVDAWAQQTPTQPAICQGPQQWSYGTLAHSAEALAAVLRQHGVGPGMVVAVTGERSFGLMASLLGVWGSGGVLLTLDPQLPRYRQQLMLHEARATCLVYVGTVRPGDAWLHDVLPTYELDPPTAQVVRGPQAGPPAVSAGPARLPDEAAYVFFTSGTTGVPKGVVGSHPGLAHFLTWQRQTFAVGPQDRCAQLTGLSFDVVLRDILLPLTSGATLCLPTAADTHSPAAVLAWLERAHISRLHVVPAVAQAWLGSVPAQVSLRALRTAFFAGEPLTASLVQQWRATFPAAGEIVNLYGPTETTLAKCYYRVPAEVRPGIQPVGGPLPETQALVLTAQQRLCGIGERGEIVLRTPFRSLGYLNAPEDMQRRFVPTPFRADPQDLLYYTGDVGEYQPDGVLRIRGRLDHQVKLRGVRIELEEISAVLAQHAGVQQAVVVLREGVGAGSEPGLVAYVSSTLTPPPTSEALRAFLLARLPTAMVPAVFVVLSALPLTPSGKVDRQALPALEQSLPKGPDPFDASQNPLEELVVGIWADVLGIERVGPQDNFFELGGHSLLATQVIARVREVLRLEMPLRSIFEASTVAGFVKRIDESRRAEQTVQLPPIVPVTRHGSIPLSYAQERMWLLDQLEPDSATYNIAVALRLRGQLHVAAFEQSLQAIVARHDALRTRFRTVDGQPVQVIVPTVTVPLPQHDLTAVPEAERHGAVQYLSQAEAQRPFDLEHDLLLRTTLLRLESQEHVFLLTLHHSIADGWSMRILLRELATHYTAMLQGNASPLPLLPIQYADFAHWQRRWLQEAAMAPQLAYWRQQLGGELPRLELPTDFPRPPVRTFRGAHQRRQLAAPVAQALRQICHQEGATLFMVLLAGFTTLLQRYTGQDDIVVGTPIAGRTHAEVEGLIGCFVNTLVLRTSLAGQPSFQDVVRRVREVALGAYAHQDVPFEKVLEELQPARDMSRTPLFQVLFNVLNFPTQRVEVPGVTGDLLTETESEAKFDLTLYVGEREQSIHLTCVYNADLFTAARITELLAQYEQLLTQAVAAPERPIAHLSLVTEGAKAVLPDPCHALHAVWPGAVTDRLSWHAEHTPERVAVCDHDTQWTYEALEARSNQLAHYLGAQGIASEDVVAIYGHRSAALVWVLLGVLKAGAAFVVLDPAHPASRLRECVQVAQPRGWLQLEAAGELPAALQSWLKTTPVRCQLEVPRVATVVPAALQGVAATPPTVAIGPQTLAYVAFTSGSTGQPKGILGEHGPLSHFLQWYSQRFDLQPTDRFSMLSGLAHDPLLRDILAPLWLGATLCVPVPEIMEDPQALATWLQQQAVSIMHLTPVLAQFVATAVREPAMAARPAVTLPHLRYAFFGGDVLIRHQVELLQGLAPTVTCVNFYGATETPQAMAYAIVGRPDALEEAPIRAHGQGALPLGHGIAQVQLLVLTAAGQLAGVGERGEIYVRTPYLTRGYLHDATLTQERFVTNPYTSAGHDRLYKTGDLGRYLPDGRVEFLGRRDQQVNLRGFRIELGDIETVLSQHPAVRQAVVAVHTGPAADSRLVAYVTPVQGMSLAGPVLRAFLHERLPAYMVPATYLMVPAIPLTPNGKVDHAALPAPDQSHGMSEPAIVAPRTPLEARIAAIWQELLGVEAVSIYDNFFDLGGHSLLAVQVIARLEKGTGVRLQLRAMVRQTLHQHVMACEEQQPALPRSGSRGLMQQLFHALKGVFARNARERQE